MCAQFTGLLKEVLILKEEHNLSAFRNSRGLHT